MKIQFGYVSLTRMSAFVSRHILLAHLIALVFYKNKLNKGDEDVQIILYDYIGYSCYFAY